MILSDTLILLNILSLICNEKSKCTDGFWYDLTMIPDSGLLFFGYTLYPVGSNAAVV